MSEPQTTTEIPLRPMPDGYTSWPDYWAARGMSWRIEPEIDGERQRYLTERCAIHPDIAQGIYPFRDESGSIKLTRADVEWLLAKHDGGQWLAQLKRATPGAPKQGLDLRGADLHAVNLRRLPLAQLVGGLRAEDWFTSSEEQREASAIHLEGATLNLASLQDATLRSAHLEGATMTSVHLEGANLRSAHLGGMVIAHEQGESSDALLVSQIALAPADLRAAYMDVETNLTDTLLGDSQHGFVKVADVHWNSVDVGSVGWHSVTTLGDEEEARRQTKADGSAKSDSERISDYAAAVRANRQLAIVLRSQGVNEQADRFAYRAQVLQRTVFLRQRSYGAYLFSLLLAALSGYGYRIWRIFAVYTLLVLAFATLYYWLGIPNDPATSVQSHVLNSLLVSLTAIHGRVFFEQFNFTAQLVGGGYRIHRGHRHRGRIRRHA